MPEPSPRPTRLRVLRLPGAGFSVCSPKSLIDLHQVSHAMHHAARLRGVLDLDRVADAAQTERAQGVDLLAVGSVAALDLRHLHAGSSSPATCASSAASVVPLTPASVSAACFPPPRPRTPLIDRPRSSATSSGRRRDCRPATVALTRLIGFCEPSDLERMSWIPASSSTARTPPPAMTPVPGEAGLGSTGPRPGMPGGWGGVGGPGLEEHAPRAVDAERLVGDRLTVLGHAEEVLLRALDGLLDGERDLVGLAVADADDVALVADDDQRGEREAPTALDDLGDAVDLDHALLEVEASGADGSVDGLDRHEVGQGRG